MRPIGKKVLWLFLAACVAVAVLRIIPWGHPADAWQELLSVADQFRNLVQPIADWFLKFISPNGIIPTSSTPGA